MQEGGSTDDCLKAAKAVIDSRILQVIMESPEEYEKVTLLSELSTLLEAYAEFYRTESFEVIAVEKVYQANIAEGIEYAMKLDLLVKWTAGKYRGDYELIDHKFVYNFKDSTELEMDGQMPKYIKTLKLNGITISKASFNQIRYRQMKEFDPNKVFLRVPARLHPYKTEAIWNEQKKYAIEIVHNPAEPLRTLSLVSCRGCYFHEICNADLMGQDTKNILSTRYQTSTYGYFDVNGET